MPNRTIFSVIESPTHPYFTALYKKLGIDELCFKSMRKLMSKIRTLNLTLLQRNFFMDTGITMRE